jgi:hypothetical protein
MRKMPTHVAAIMPKKTGVLTFTGEGAIPELLQPRMFTCGPTMVRTDAMDCKGTTVPLLLRIKMSLRSEISRRSSAIACRLTCHVRPERLKLLIK